MTLLFLFTVEQNTLLFGKYWWIVGLFIPLFATVGDLIQSYFKRRAKVKDSGSLLPGHGGFMRGRCDLHPFYYLLLKFLIMFHKEGYFIITIYHLRHVLSTEYFVFKN